MTTGRTTLQLARIILLLFLLRATGWYVNDLHQGVTRLQVDEVWAPWTGVSLVSGLFVTVMLVGRRRWHPWIVLAVEAIVAAVLAFMPPVQWVIWLGINGWLNALVGGFVQPLAVAWVGVVVLRGFHQLRDADAYGPRASGGCTGTPEGSDKDRRIISA